MSPPTTTPFFFVFDKSKIMYETEQSKKKERKKHGRRSNRTNCTEFNGFTLCCVCSCDAIQHNVWWHRCVLCISSLFFFRRYVVYIEWLHLYYSAIDHIAVTVYVYKCLSVLIIIHIRILLLSRVCHSNMFRHDRYFRVITQFAFNARLLIVWLVTLGTKHSWCGNCGPQPNGAFNPYFSPIVSKCAVIVPKMLREKNMTKSMWWIHRRFVHARDAHGPICLCHRLLGSPFMETGMSYSRQNDFE